MSNPSLGFEQPSCVNEMGGHSVAEPVQRRIGHAPSRTQATELVAEPVVGHVDLPGRGGSEQPIVQPGAGARSAHEAKCALMSGFVVAPG